MDAEHLNLVGEYLSHKKDIKEAQDFVTKYQSQTKRFLKWLEGEPTLIVITEDSYWYPRGLSTQRIHYADLDDDQLRKSLEVLQTSLPEAGRLKQLLVNVGADLESLDEI